MLGPGCFESAAAARRARHSQLAVEFDSPHREHTLEVNEKRGVPFADAIEFLRYLGEVLVSLVLVGSDWFPPLVVDVLCRAKLISGECRAKQHTCQFCDDSDLRRSSAPILGEIALLYHHDGKSVQSRLDANHMIWTGVIVLGHPFNGPFEYLALIQALVQRNRPIDTRRTRRAGRIQMMCYITRQKSILRDSERRLLDDGEDSIDAGAGNLMFRRCRQSRPRVRVPLPSVMDVFPDAGQGLSGKPLNQNMAEQADPHVVRNKGGRIAGALQLELEPDAGVGVNRRKNARCSASLLRLEPGWGPSLDGAFP